MKIKKDVKRIKVSFCILFRVEEEEEEYKNKERESDKTDQPMNSKEENSHKKQYSH